MAFSISGTLKGGSRNVLVEWDNGALTGDEEAVTAFETQAYFLEDSAVGLPEGPYTYTDHIKSGLSVIALASDLFIAGTIRYGGDVPMRPEIPAGAIG